MSHLKGRVLRVTPEDWPEYAAECPDIGYWTGKVTSYNKKAKKNKFQWRCVEDGENSDLMHVDFEWIRDRLELLSGELRIDITLDRRKRRSSSLHSAHQSIAGGARGNQSEEPTSPTQIRKPQYCVMADVTPTKQIALTHVLPDARVQTDSAAVHTTPKKKRARDESMWCRVKKRVQLGFRYRSELKSAAQLCSRSCKNLCASVSTEHRERLREQLNEIYGKQGQYGVYKFLDKLISRKTRKGPLAHITRKQRDLLVTRGMRCVYCRLGIGSLADVAPGAPRRNHNFTPLVTRERVHGQNLVTGCPFYEEGTAHFDQQAVEAAGGNSYRLKGEFSLPSVHASGSRLEVCRRFFSNTFGLGKWGKIISTILKRDQSVVEMPNPHARNAGRDKNLDKGKETMELIKEHIKLFPRYDTHLPTFQGPCQNSLHTGIEHIAGGYFSCACMRREASHYSNDMNHGATRYFLAPDLSRTKLWQLYCQKEKPEFVEQAERMGWWNSLDRTGTRPSLPEGEAMLSPPIECSWYRKLLNLYELCFGRLKIDTCDKCDNFKHALGNCEPGSPEERKVAASFASHKKQADESYDSRNHDTAKTRRDFPIPLCKDAKPAYNSVKGIETQSQDFGGNLRTPRLTVGEAFYLRILPTFVYSIFSEARRCTVLYFWNEKIAEKGANNCVSVEHYQHLNYPSGAVHLVKWYDGTYSQCNNGTMLRYNLEITDPDIPEMFMYEQINVKIPPTGHTYLVNDTWFGKVRKSSTGA